MCLWSRVVVKKSVGKWTSNQELDYYGVFTLAILERPVAFFLKVARVFCVATVGRTCVSRLTTPSFGLIVLLLWVIGGGNNRDLMADKLTSVPSPQI